MEELEDIDVTASTRCGFEVGPNGCSKASGLHFLCSHLGVSMKETVAIGDFRNDIEMIRQAGLGVAMGNAPEEVQKAADWVTRSNDQNGVGYMVREVFRRQMKMQIEQPVEY
jgi:hydroxymethylpyrimidine pyrophosphatase-like HAD family hydrolase